jgi:hypothetical protein
LNPFRLQDEEQMLAKRTHNRRRWSHVFPPGEIEFKRQSGPNWKSLCQPAVLPLTTDFHPEEYELNDPTKYEFNHYNIFTDAVDLSYYKSLDDLLMEMVIQRIIQDYQIVPDAVVRESQNRSEARRKALLTERKRKGNKKASSGWPSTMASNQFSLSRILNTGSVNKQFILSMGHNVHKLIFNPQTSEIEVVQYHAKFAQNDDSNTYKYHYSLWMPLSKTFQSVSQTFSKFGTLYRWNNLDNLICGDPQKVLSEGFRYRRLGFCIVPDPVTDAEKEHDYVQRLLRLLDYVGKLQHKEAAAGPLGIKVISTFGQSSAKRGSYVGEEPVRHLNIQLKKGARDKYEWMELVLDEYFDTRRTYRIGMHWLVASGSKVEAQVQSLLRRAAHFGLTIVPCPQYATSNTLYLHPFMAPFRLGVMKAAVGRMIESQLIQNMDYVFDGRRWVDPFDFEDDCPFEFPLNTRGKRRRLLGRHYMHRSGLGFLRVLQDEKETMVFLWVKNRLQIGQNLELTSQASGLFYQMMDCIQQMQPEI